MPAWAQAPLLRLAFSELAPWKTLHGGTHTGAYTEIVGELARRTGHRLEFIDCPLKRCLKLLEAGDADAVIGVQQSPDRLRYLAYLNTPYRRTSSDRVFLVRRGESQRIARYEDLRELRIAVKSGSEYFDRFDEDSSLTKDASPSNQTSLRKLILNRVDAVVMPEDQALALIADMELQAKVEVAAWRVPDPTPRSIAISRQSALIKQLPDLERTMREMREDGSLARIYSRHYYQRYRVSRQRLTIE